MVIIIYVSSKANFHVKLILGNGMNERMNVCMKETGKHVFFFLARFVSVLATRTLE